MADKGRDPWLYVSDPPAGESGRSPRRPFRATFSRDVYKRQDSNTGFAYIDKTENTLTIQVMISASINTGAPSGPKQEIVFDLDSGGILEKSTEDYTGEPCEGGISAFPDLTDERWIEISNWFKDVILTAEKEYAQAQS